MNHVYKIDDRVIHPEHGLAIVRFTGEDYIGLEFADGRNVYFGWISLI